MMIQSYCLNIFTASGEKDKCIISEAESLIFSL